MKLSEDELEIIRHGVTTVLAQRPLQVFVVGSFARHEQIRSSDLDLLIQTPQPLNLIDLGALRAFFDDSDLVYVIDLIDYHQVDAKRRDSLLRDAKPIAQA